MKTSHTVPLLLATALLAICGSSFADNALDDITNYREYSATLSSSGQPSTSQLQSVKAAGFERVVFLAFSDSDGSISNEDRIVEDLGMEYVHIPVDWEAPRASDFEAFAAAMQSAPNKRTLVHCQVNFRASTFSFLYRVLYQDTPVGEAKDALNSVWVPNDTWRGLIFEVLEKNGVSPQCDTCLWE